MIMKVGQPKQKQKLLHREHKEHKEHPQRVDADADGRSGLGSLRDPVAVNVSNPPHNCTDSVIDESNFFAP